MNQDENDKKKDCFVYITFVFHTQIHRFWIQLSFYSDIWVLLAFYFHERYQMKQTLYSGRWCSWCRLICLQLFSSQYFNHQSQSWLRTLRTSRFCTCKHKHRFSRSYLYIIQPAWTNPSWHLRPIGAFYIMLDANNWYIQLDNIPSHVASHRGDWSENALCNEP